ncbi:MAG: beta-ketoacyl-[acyl-carrier-protein] synthase family protein [Bacteroidales bacterium]|jgi:3-oxoacyl-[acyl-carrier-protein] synthase-1|nr:beta-ketoacyl-[acyl-carrier-protein] synthase family protein [Bacteroidales bacterium]
MDPVFITGMGIITSIGRDTEENLASLKAERPGIRTLSTIESVHRGILPAGEILLSDEELASLAEMKYADGLSRTALMGMIAAREALENAKCLAGDGNRTGFISGSTVGGMAATEKFYPDYLANDSRNAWIDTNESRESTERIADLLGIRDFVSTINTACSSSANAIMIGARMIRAGMIDRVIAGGVDSLSMFTLNGFNTLMIYDKAPCRPFDENRNGLNLGEGAAYLVLESEKSLGGRSPLCRLTGWGNSTDAHHQTALSPEGTGPFLAMQAALAVGALNPADISYLNVHGTATVNNDLAEGIGMKRLFGENWPLFSSTKPFTGHLLGASGSVESVYAILSILNDTAWANLNFSTPMKELDKSPVARTRSGAGIRHVMTNSFGFGGNNTSLIFSVL